MVTQIPTLFIGIGGIGCQIAGTISDMLPEEARGYVGFVGVDTDINDLTKRQKEKHNIRYIQTSESWDVNEYLSRYPENEKWFPEQRIIRGRNMTNGAGQVRALSRLSFLASQESGKFDLIFEEIDRIRRVTANPNSNLVIVIVGSITGGTGAGMFIELPLLIRKTLKTKYGLDDCTIRGMFIGPDITEKVQPEDFMKENVRVNGYTCLKELNAFNIHHIERDDIPDEVAKSIELENYDSNDTSPKNVPYNYLYLYEKGGRLGTTGEAKLEEMIKYISHIAFNLLFTPIQGGSASVEDNLILQSIRQNNLNRFVGAGICRLIFPIEDAQEYVTLSLVNDMVEKEWLLLDNRFRSQNELATERRESDHTIELPVLSEVYVKEFRKETIDGDNNTKLLAKLANDAFDFNETTHKYTSKADSFLKIIETKVNNLVASDDVLKYEAACKVDETQMTNFNSAIPEVDRVWSAMREYALYALQLKNDTPNSYADDLFPFNFKAMIQQKDSPSCIYSYIARVHPIAARFLIYDMINKLETTIEGYKKALKNVNINAYMDKDFDEVSGDDVIDTPGDVILALKKSYEENPLWRMFGFVGDAIRIQEKSISSLKLDLVSVSDDHIASVKKYIKNSIKCEVSKIILERLKALAKGYERFFFTIEKNLDKNRNKLFDLTHRYYTYGEDGVYCSQVAYDRMTAEFKIKQNQALTLSDVSKMALFEKILSIEIESKPNIHTAVLETLNEIKRRTDKVEDDINSAFAEAIVDTVRASVIENGAHTVNLTVKEALLKECEIMAESGVNESQYINNRINTALRIATPMISLTDAGNRNNELIFMAVNKSNSINNDTISTLNYYFSGGNNQIGNHNKPNIMIDEAFSEQEIDIIKITYDHVIEDLVQYGPSSQNAVSYNARISALEIGLKSNFNVEVNPHLNRYWHEEGYIPSMYRAQRERDLKDLTRAFLYGLGFDLLVKRQKTKKDAQNNTIVLEYWKCMLDTMSNAPIKKNGEAIGTNFVDLYNSLFFNGAMKRMVLDYAQAKIEEFKRSGSTNEIAQRVLDYELIEDFIQTDKARQKAAEYNIFEIILDMHNHMHYVEWKNLVKGLRDLLWEVFIVLFDGDEEMINDKTREVLIAIKDNSSLNQEALSDVQTELLDLYNQIIVQDYVKS